MSKELDEKLKKALGSVRPLDGEGFTNAVVDRLREELKKEQRHSVLRQLFRGLNVLGRGVSKSVGSGRLAQAGRSGPFARKYATVLKIAAGLAAVVAISMLIFIADYGPATSAERSESSQVSTKLDRTLPSYALSERIDLRVEETRPCDILPPLAD